jgi:hypothetical protein
MAFFTEKMPAEKLAFMLLIFSVRGDLSICFLRGWTMFFVLGHFFPEKILEAVMERYASLLIALGASANLHLVARGRC